MASRTEQLVNRNQPAFNEFLKARAPQVIYSQTPPAGTPVPQGMTIEVKIFSPSDVPLSAVAENVPPELELLMLEDIEDLVETDPTVKGASTSGTLDPANEAAFIDAFNRKAAGRGGTAPLAPTEGQKVLGLLKNTGFARS